MIFKFLLIRYCVTFILKKEKKDFFVILKQIIYP